MIKKIFCGVVANVNKRYNLRNLVFLADSADYNTF